MNNIGVDLGGTKINFVLLKNSKVFESFEVATPKSRNKLIEVLEENIRRLARNSKINSIGLGVPGPLNMKGDLILAPPNLKYLSKYPLGKVIQKKLKIKTVMENDANCFVLGEALIGAGRGAESVLGVTLGTGVGGGIVMNGQVYRGKFGSAGEIGHMILNFNGPKCGCSNYGCFEVYGSEKFIISRTGMKPKALGLKAFKGDKKALKTFADYGRFVGMGLAGLANILDPEIIIIGGGISRNYSFFIKSAEKEMRKDIISPNSKKYVKIKKAKLGKFAGAIGAALLINTKQHA